MKYNPPKNEYYQLFPRKHKFFGVSFTCDNMLNSILTVSILDLQSVLFSISSVTHIYFKLANISKSHLEFSRFGCIYN